MSRPTLDLGHGTLIDVRQYTLPQPIKFPGYGWCRFRFHWRVKVNGKLVASGDGRGATTAYQSAIQAALRGAERKEQLAPMGVGVKRERVELAVGQVWRNPQGRRQKIVAIRQAGPTLFDVTGHFEVTHDTHLFGGRGWGAYRFYDEDQPT